MTSISFPGNNHGIQIGDNRGPITAEFYLSPKPSETPPNPLSTVPFARDPDFVSRDTLLHQIYEKSSVPGSRIALVGLGGVGKSRLAIEYSYQIRSESPSTWVFWVHASNEARFEQSFRDIADQVKIPGRQDPNSNILQLVESWLRDKGKGRWVCILDNADDYEILCPIPVVKKGDPMKEPPNAFTKPLSEYIPRGPHGSIIITCRSRDVALKMVSYKDLIEIEPMEKFEALQLFQRKLGQPQQSQQSQQSQTLVEVLEFMPLAIAQAASYIRARAPRYSVSQYLKDFQASDREAIKLLEKEAACLDRDWEAKNSILVTWQISFNYIQRKQPSAAELLAFMSFFDRQGIPETLVRPHLESRYKSTSEFHNDPDEVTSSESDTGPEFEDDVMTLRDYLLVSTSECGTFFTMHRLVQLTTRSWLKSHGQINRWKEKFIGVLYREFPTGQYENWGKCRVLYPHVRSAMSQRPENERSLLDWATLLYRCAWFASEIGNVADVRKMALKSRFQRAKFLGGEDEDTLASTAMLARAYSLEGRWGEAAQLEEQIMETRMTKLGVEHAKTLISMASLASTYREQGRWGEAEQLELQVLEIRKHKLGVGHTATLMTTANLASTYKEQGRLGEAELLFVHVMKIFKKKLGEEHPDTLAIMANLASTYVSQGRLAKAKELFLQVSEVFKAKYGQEHPNTLKSMGNLAMTYMRQGQFVEAVTLSAQIVSIFKRNFGKDHPHTLTSMNNHAFIYSEQGRWQDAENLHMQVIEARKRQIGENHPNMLSSMSNLATIYMRQHRWGEAEKLHMQVAEARKMKLCKNHPDLLASLANLASTYRNQRRFEEAESLNKEVMETRKTLLGNDHPDTLTSMVNLASTYWSQGRCGEAEKLFVRVMETRKKNYGEDHPSTVMSMTNVARILKCSGLHKNALDLLEVCVAKQKRILGPSHPHTVTTSATLLDWAKDA